MFMLFSLDWPSLMKRQRKADALKARIKYRLANEDYECRLVDPGPYRVIPRIRHRIKLVEIGVWRIPGHKTPGHLKYITVYK